MLATSHKFPLRTDFFTFHRQAQTASSKYLTLYYLTSPLAPRLAVVVPKKTSRLSTTRNWLKRLTYSVVWPLVKDKNLDLVIIYRPHKLIKSPNLVSQITTDLKSLIPNY